MLQGNPLRCDIQLLEVSQWLRRWLREQVRSSVLDVRQRAVSSIRQTTCVNPDTDSVISIFHLQPDHIPEQSKATYASATLTLLVLFTLVFQLFYY